MPNETAVARGSFIFISQLLGRPVVDGSTSARIGHIVDLVASPTGSYPKVIALTVRHGMNSVRRVSWDGVDRLDDSRFVLKLKPQAKVTPMETTPDELMLKDEFLDMQIVDTYGCKVERVNDLHLLQTGGNLWLVHVDVGFRGFLRRLGWERPITSFAKWAMSYDMKDMFINWKYVQPIGREEGIGQERVKVCIPHKRLTDMHPADLADVIEELDVHERAAMFLSLDPETAADALREVEKRTQRLLLDALPVEKAARIFEALSPADAADLLPLMSRKTAEDILMTMDKLPADRIRALLEHHEESAGGLMTNAYIALSGELTAETAIARIRELSARTDVLYYCYIVDDEGLLMGVVNLRELFTSPPATKLHDIMTHHVVTVHPETGVDEVKRTFAKYGLRAVPVVDEAGKMLGTIRFKKMMDLMEIELKS